MDDPPRPRSRRASHRAKGPKGGEDQRRPRKRKQMPLWQEMPILLVVAFCLAVLIRTFLVQAFFIPSTSMVGTLLVGDRVLVNKVVYDMRGPRRGEIVVFSGTNSWVPEVPPEPDLGFSAKFGRTVGDLVGVSRPGDKDFIKRVVGLPGDRVACCDAQGRVQVNGQPIDEPYIAANSPLDAPPDPRSCGSRRFAEVLVEPGKMFVMGDNRLVSQDARCQGQVPIDNIIGKAILVVWPRDRWAPLPMPSTFDNQPVALAPAAQPVREDPDAGDASGTFGIVMPILLSLLGPVASRFSARSGRESRAVRRRLSE
ncbi:MAG TPA: signal peptidase I [Pilimelia sp.]|nr:signal peptidase I [Pilimelia sp.]